MSILPFDGVGGPVGSAFVPSFVRRIKRRRRWCHIRTKPFNQIDYGDSRADEDDGADGAGGGGHEMAAVVPVNLCLEVQLA